MANKSYHFDCGDSSKGPIGFCARVIAPSKKKALKRLRAFLEACAEVSLTDSSGDEHGHIEYCNVYISEENVSVNDIDEEDSI